MKLNRLLDLKYWGTTRLLTVGFAFVILLGTLLLMLPISTRSGSGINFLDAMFTSTSATCVTGLSLFDIYTKLSFFGQVVLLILIQVGGLGFIMVMVLFSLATHRRIGLRERSLLADGVGSLQLTGVVRMARRIILGTALFEGIGAAILVARFVPRFGFGEGLWISLFHSVSAFCNAGFDLMGIVKPSSSLTLYYDDPVVVITIGMLIIFGGIGFVVWTDLMDCNFKVKKVGYHTKVVVISTLVLLIGGTLLFFITEKNASMQGMNLGNRLLSSFFQSVTPRTAGFNTVDISSLSGAGKLLTMFLMFVGAAPGGTGGGIKVTTFVVILATAYASQTNKNDTVVGQHRIHTDAVKKAFCTVSSYMGLIFIGTFIICAQGTSLVGSAFECVSAIGTVGLSTGVTASMTGLSKMVLILLMYTGRLGSLTVFLAMSGCESKGGLRNPVGKLLVG